MQMVKREGNVSRLKDRERIRNKKRENERKENEKEWEKKETERRNQGDHCQMQKFA